MLEHNGTFLSDLLSSPAALLLLHAQLLDDVPEGGHGGVDHLLRGEEEVLGPQLQYGLIHIVSLTRLCTTHHLLVLVSLDPPCVRVLDGFPSVHPHQVIWKTNCS